MARVEQRAKGSAGRIGTLGPLVVGVYEGPGDVTMLDELERIQNEAVAHYGKISSLSIVATPKVESPPAAYRERSAALATKFQPHMHGTAIVILSTGAAAVIARTYLVAHALLVKQQSPQQTFRNLADAVMWLKTLPGQVPQLAQLAELTAAVEAFTFPAKR